MVIQLLKFIIPFLILLFLGVVSLFLSFFSLKKNSKSAGNLQLGKFFLLSCALLLGLFSVFFCAEIIFLLKYKTLYFYKSQLRLTNFSSILKGKRDTGLIPKDFNNNVLRIGQDQLLRDEITVSPNARFSQVGNTMTLQSLDDKPAFIEIKLAINTLSIFENKPYPYFIAFSTMVKNFSVDSFPTTTIDYLDSVSVSPFSYQYPFQQKSILLTFSPHYLEEDIYFDSEHRERFKEKIMKLRMAIKSGTVVFTDTSLIALRQYGIFDNRISAHGDSDRFGSAMGFFVQKINYKNSPTVKRIIFLGGSTMYGANYSTIEATIPKWFDFKIQSTHPNKYEVFNAGINSATTVSMINGFTPKTTDNAKIHSLKIGINEADYIFDVLKFNYFDLHPDIVIIVPMYNDFFLYRSKGPSQRIFDKFITNPSLRFIFENYALGYYIFSYLKSNYQKNNITENFVNSDLTRFLKSYNNNPIDCINQYRNNLNFIVKQLRSHGIKVYLTALPNPALYRSKPSLPASPYSFYLDVLKKINRIDEEIIKTTAEQNHVPYIDLRAYFGIFPQETDMYIYSIDYVHLRPLGNAMVADLLWASIINDLE